MTEFSAETPHETSELLLLSFPGVIKILKGEKGGGGVRLPSPYAERD